MHFVLLGVTTVVRIQDFQQAVALQVFARHSGPGGSSNNYFPAPMEEAVPRSTFPFRFDARDIPLGFNCEALELILVELERAMCEIETGD